VALDCGLYAAHVLSTGNAVYDLLSRLLHSFRLGLMAFDQVHYELWVGNLL
jgi:hypothetical protein